MKKYLEATLVSLVMVIIILIFFKTLPTFLMTIPIMVVTVLYDDYLLTSE